MTTMVAGRLGSAMFAAYAGLFVLAPAMPAMSAAFSVGSAVLGQLRTVAALAALGTLALMLARPGRLSIRGTIRLGLLLSAAGSLLVALAPSAVGHGLLVLVLGHIPLGAGLALVASGCPAASADWIRDRRRAAQVLARTMIVAPVAAIAVSPVSGVLVTVDWRLPWLLPTVLGLASWWSLTGRAPEPRPSAASALGPRWAARPALRLWACGELLAYSGWSVVLVYGIALLVDSYGDHAVSASAVLGIAATAFTVTTLLARRLPQSARVLLLGGSVAMACAGLAFGVLRPGFGTSAGLFVLLGLVCGARVLAGSARGLELLPEARLQAMTLRTLAQQSGYLIGAGAGGAVLVVWGFSGLGVLIAVMYLLSAAVHRRSLVAVAEPARAIDPS